jgi:hypothetical protein
MADDLLDRVSDPSGDVDDGAEWAPPAGARKRRVVLTGVAGAVVVVVLGVAARSWTHTGDRQAVTADPTSSATHGLVSASTIRDRIELTLTVPAGQVEVGHRVRAEVVIRNAGNAPVHWMHDGCAVPASVVLTSAGAPVVERRLPSHWDGATSLAVWLRSHNALAPKPLADSKAAGVRSPLCHPSVTVETIAPGADTRWSGVTDARVPPGSLALQEVAASFVGYSQTADYPATPRRPVDVRVSVPVLDDPGRAPSADAAIAAFAADRRLRPFLDRTRHALDGNPVSVFQTWATELSWWQGSWELCVTPYYNGGQALRLRYDPRVRAVVDGRLISPYAPPGDDPDHTTLPGQPPDTLLP